MTTQPCHPKKTTRTTQKNDYSNVSSLVLMVLSLPDCYIIVDLLLIIKQYFFQLVIKRQDLIDLYVELGAGASSVVRLVKHRPTNQHYAIKVLTMDAEDKENAARLKSWCRRPRHRNWLSLDAAFNLSNRKLYILSEYMDKGSLHDVLESVTEPVPEPIVCYIAKQVCRALRFMHVVTKNKEFATKPSRILFNSVGEIKLSDFHLPIRENHEEAYIYVHAREVYKPPERIRGKTTGVASDVWSLGMICCHLCLGKLPIAECSFYETFQQIQKFRRTTKFPGYSDECFVWISSCLQPNPSDRPTVTDLLHHKWLQGDIASKQTFAEWLPVKKDTHVDGRD
eukprot:TRINITY_DN76009_c0_g1_i1.p1 TRINITY_DN76009_c0_g1~~TRINITY_DN76009_c0_g1_i1.p1  ORF type:complete len:339 (+),score=-0.42 TRINITY_DN76009_c0_g1_i1:187-1203(+)